MLFGRRKKSSTQAKARSEWGEFIHSWRYLFGLIALIGLVALFYAEEDWRGERAWERYVQNMRAHGQPCERRDFIPPKIADAQNFAMTPLLGSAFGYRPSTKWRNRGPNYIRTFAQRYDEASQSLKPSTRRWGPGGAPPVDLRLWYAAFQMYGRTNLSRALRLVTNDTPSGDISLEIAAKGILDALEEAEPALDELREARSRPFSRFSVHYEQDDPASILLPHLGALKRICQVVQLHARAKLALGDLETSMDDIELMFRLASSIQDEPIIVSQLVRFAMLQMTLQVIREGMTNWPDAPLKDLQRQMLEFDLCKDTRRVLQGECFVFGGGIIDYIRKAPDKYDVLSSVFSSGAATQSGDSLAGAAMTISPEGWFYFERLNYTRSFEKHILPTIDVDRRIIRPSAVRKAENEIANGRRVFPLMLLQHRFFSGLLLPSVLHVSQNGAFMQNAVNCSVLACAVELYRHEHGALPETVQLLAPRYIPKLPHDIINGEPLKYSRTADGHYTFYSVGWDEKDDGGRIIEDKADSSSPGKHADWVWSF